MNVLDYLKKKLDIHGYPFSIEKNIIPQDDTTLFVCSGMQNFKNSFRGLTDGKIATLQSCIRTNDLDLVGDGIHLTYFEMIGNFNFNQDEYEYSMDLWTEVLYDLSLIKNCVIHYHPLSNLRVLWEHNGFEVVPDESCLWSDGDVGGYCCEVYWKGMEIGNLVNIGGRTDVGFGFERLIMAVEGAKRVDETSLFDQSYVPIARDLIRTLNSFWENGIDPGNKGRNYICRRLIRKMLPYYHKESVWSKWIEDERDYREKCLLQGQKIWKRHKDKSYEWWRESCGLTKEDVDLIRDNNEKR